MFQIYIYTSFCVGTSLLGALCLCFLRLDIQSTTVSNKSVRKNILAVCLLMVKSRDQNLLIIPSLSRGITLSFLMGDFTAVSWSKLYKLIYITSLVPLNRVIHLNTWLPRLSMYHSLYYLEGYCHLMYNNVKRSTKLL